jgi:hypothetical protein
MNQFVGVVSNPWFSFNAGNSKVFYYLGRITSQFLSDNRS